MGDVHHRHARLTALGIALCLLAALFAIEAKIAWFSPDGGSTAHISSLKLQAADAPKLIAKVLARTAPTVHAPEIFAALAFVLFSVLSLVRISTANEALHPVLPGYFPAHFFRPPPVR